MANVLLVFGTLLLLGLAVPGALVTWWLLWPEAVDRARRQIGVAPLRCWWLGVATGVGVLVPVVALLGQGGGPGQAVGGLIALVALAFAVCGAAGLVAHLGERLATRTTGGLSPAAAFLRAAVALELAAVIPVFGWFLVLPVALGVALGAAVSATLAPLGARLALTRRAAAEAPSGEG